MVVEVVEGPKPRIRPRRVAKDAMFGRYGHLGILEYIYKACSYVVYVVYA